MFSHTYFSTMNLFIMASLSFISCSSSLELQSCDDLHEAVDMVMLENVNVTMHPFADIICDKFTTFTLSDYNLNIMSSNDDPNHTFHGNANFQNVRFEVVNGANLTFSTDILFETHEDNDDIRDINGGAFYIGKGSSVRFFSNFETRNIGVRSETEESSDFADHQNDGGCIWNNGYFRVDGSAIMSNCKNQGGGESSPGRGGAIFNDVEGSVLFSNGVEISDVRLTDDEGNDGGGFYNFGKVVIKGPSSFFDLRAESAGAIYNALDAVFKFKDDATALFYKCRAFDGYGGAIINSGLFKFSGPALFISGSADYKGSQIVVGSSGLMKIKKNSYFFDNTCSEPNCSTIWVEEGGELKYSKTTQFVNSVSGYDEILCEGVYFEDGEVCFN